MEGSFDDIFRSIRFEFDIFLYGAEDIVVVVVEGLG